MDAKPTHDKPAEGSIDGLLGPIMLSAVSSLSIHLAPVVVLGMTTVSGFSPSNAGLVFSFRAVGEFVAACLLPMAVATGVGRLATAAFCICLLSGLALASFGGLTGLFTGFLLVGISNGALKLTGTISVSLHSNRAFAFALRLALVLMLGGSATLMFQVFPIPASHAGLMGLVLAVHVPLLVAGMVLYRPPAVPDDVDFDAGDTQFAYSGMAIVFLFFVVVSGFVAFSAQQAIAHGIAASQAILAIGVAKLLAGLWLICEAFYLRKTNSSIISPLMTGLLIAAVWAVYGSRNVIEFALAFLLLEIMLNRYSARLQSAIVEASPDLGMRTLNLSILGGSIVGPALFGLAVEWNLVVALVAVGSAVIALPLFWQRSARWRSKGA
ncbi:MAG: hypothetical protein ACKVON_10580 [Beijerinckiaceae bacterium]